MSIFLEKEIKPLNEKSLLGTLNPFMKRNIEFGNSNELVILVHGWISSCNTLEKLAERFNKKNYCVYRLDLSTTFGSIKNLEEEIKDQLDQINYGIHFKKVHIVAHSMGGIVTQIILQNHKIPNLGRIVTLGTPYLGSPLWKRVAEMDIPFLKDSYVVVNNRSLLDRIKKRKYKNKKIEIGLIAGTKTYVIRKMIEIEQKLRKDAFAEENDGSVEVKSALGLTNGYVKDTIKIKKNHFELIQDALPFRLAERFLRTGKFKN